MQFLLQLLSHFFMITIASVLSIFFILKFAIPTIMAMFMPKMDFEDEEEDDDIPLMVSVGNRGNMMDELEEMNPAKMKQDMDDVFNRFLSGDPILVGYKKYETHREIEFGPPIQCGTD